MTFILDDVAAGSETRLGDRRHFSDRTRTRHLKLMHEAAQQISDRCRINRAI